VTTAISLVDRCVAGEAEAWRELHRTYYPVVRTFLRRLGVRGNEEEDASQEVFVQVLRYLKRFEQRAELKTWLYRLCMTQANVLRRRRALRARLSFFFAAQPAPIAHTEDAGLAWSEADMDREVARALAGMKARHREVFVLYELEGLSGEDVARILRCPEPTVWRRLHHARREFGALVTGAEPEQKRDTP
jgi:RNA polymerase sigma-70 factor (ECF subfamily)